MMFADVYRGKRVLVTGHTGFKGSWLCQWLRDLGAEVYGFSLYVPSQPSHFEVIGLESRVKGHYVGDVRSYEQVLNAIQKCSPEAVFHLAAQPIVRTSYDDPKLTFDTNVGGTVNVLEAIRHTGSVKAAVMITSDKCYENVEWEYGYRESDRLGGKDPYSASKACAEIAISSYMRSFFSGGQTARVASARAGNVIGGGDWAKDRIIPDCVRSWAEGRSSLIRNPQATRPWQHVLEPLGGYLLIGARLLSGGEKVANESFNFGPPADSDYPVIRLVEEMKKLWPGVQWHGEPVASGGKEATLLKLCCDKALTRLNWQPTLSFEETMNMTTSWYLAYYGKSGDMNEFSSRQIREYEEWGRQRGKEWAK